MPPYNVNRSRSLPARPKRSTSINYGAHIDDFSVYHNDYEEIYPDVNEIQAAQQAADLSAALQLQHIQYASDATDDVAERGGIGNEPQVIGNQLRAIVAERRALAAERQALADERRAIYEYKNKRGVKRKPISNLQQIEEGAKTDTPSEDSSWSENSTFVPSRAISTTESLGVKRWLSLNTRETSWRYILEGPANLQLTNFNSNLVGWGVDDPLNPKNWSNARKWTAVLIVSSFNLITPISSSMVAPALPQIGRDLNISSTTEEALVLSIFLLAYAVGPLIFGPLSEVYGRVPVLQLANLFYLLTNLICGFAKSKGVLLAFRFFAGIGGSAPLAIGGAVIADLFRPDERGRAVSLYTIGPLLGPAIGPIAGAFIAASTTWRWAFWSTSIVDSAIQILALLFLRESYPPLILRRKAESLRKETGNKDLHTEFDTPDRTTKNILTTALVRPFRLLGSQATIQFLGVFMAFIYGLIYLLLSTFPTVWIERYHEGIAVGGLNYISIGLGFFLGTILCATVNDRIYQRLKARNNGIGRAEFRIPMMIPGTLLVPVGLFWYGWSVQARIHWIMPDIGALIFSVGTIICFQCIQTYIVDAYSRYAASAMAAIMVLRSLAGFGFPLFAPAMYRALGDGWGNSLLAFFSMALGTPAALVLWFYGQKLRERNQFAVGD